MDIIVFLLLEVLLATFYKCYGHLNEKPTALAIWDPNTSKSFGSSDSRGSFPPRSTVFFDECTYCRLYRRPCVQLHCQDGIPGASGQLIKQDSSRRFDMCTYCRMYKQWCVPLYCPGGFLPNLRHPGGSGIQKSGDFGRRFDMCTYCRMYKQWCVPLYCPGGFLPNVPNHGGSGIQKSGDFGKRFDMCTFCRKHRPWCVPLYCVGGIPPDLNPVRDMCTYCRTLNHWCVYLYCPGGFRGQIEGSIQDLPISQDVTSPSGWGPSPGGDSMCAFCQNYYPSCVPHYCSSRWGFGPGNRQSHDRGIASDLIKNDRGWNKKGSY